MTDQLDGPDEASSPASSTTEPAGLLADAGPEFDPEASPVDAPPASGTADALAGGDVWEVSRVRAVLLGKGELLHGALAIDPDSTEWRYTDADLRAIAPALTRILNRYEPTRAAAAAGDELAVAIGFAGYGMRSYSERRRAQAEQARYAEPEPEPGQITVPAVDDARAGDVDDTPQPVPPIPSRRY